MKPTTRLTLGVVVISLAVGGTILAQVRKRAGTGVANDAAWSTETLGDPYQAACNAWPELCLDPSECQSDCTGVAPGALDNCDRVCGGGTGGALGLFMSYVPSQGATRTQSLSYSAAPATVAIYYQESLGGFETRPGGACYAPPENATFLKVGLVGGTITACRYRASWDTAYYTCVPAVIQALNAGANIIINTDFYLADLRTCVPHDPLVIHLRFNVTAWLDIELTNGAGTVVRRVQFVKNPLTGPIEPPNPGPQVP